MTTERGTLTLARVFFAFHVVVLVSVWAFALVFMGDFGARYNAMGIQMTLEQWLSANINYILLNHGYLPLGLMVVDYVAMARLASTSRGLMIVIGVGVSILLVSVLLLLLYTTLALIVEGFSS